MGGLFPVKMDRTASSGHYNYCYPSKDGVNNGLYGVIRAVIVELNTLTNGEWQHLTAKYDCIGPRISLDQLLSLEQLRARVL